ncbi:MAG: tetratricopeptide repeat protein [Cognatishimia sp.]
MLATSAVASTCPPAPDHDAALDALFSEIQSAPTQTDGLILGQGLWAFWADAPDEKAQGLLNYGMELRNARDFSGALDAFGELISYCPNYAEGYNQRAIIRFVQQDFEAVLPDLDRALSLSPRHLGALSGRAMTLIALGRDYEAQTDLLAALALNPWLPERRFLLPPPEDADQEL